MKGKELQSMKFWYETTTGREWEETPVNEVSPNRKDKNKFLERDAIQTFLSPPGLIRLFNYFLDLTVEKSAERMDDEGTLVA